MQFWLMGIIAGCLLDTTYSNQQRIDRCRGSELPIAKVINNLSHKLVAKFGGNGNLFFSPISISLALGMLYLGARGKSAQEMREVLDYDLVEGTNSDDIHLHFRSLLALMQQDANKYMLLFANGIFTQAGFGVLPEYTSYLQRVYNAEQETLDFAHDGDEAVKIINEWVSNNTMGKIPQLFSRKLDPMTIMVLINAVYFKGLWQVPFPEMVTYPREFYSINGSERRIPFMELIGSLKYHSDPTLAYDFLELDYKGKKVSMIFALPHERERFPDLEITGELICSIRSSMRKSRTEVYLPKFKLEYERELLDDMRDLGMVEVFSQELSNLTGIREDNFLYVSRMTHKAVIDVNEKGTEAAAVTSINFTSRSGQARDNNVFFANHPFAFVILDKRTGTILFTGRVVDI